MSDRPFRCGAQGEHTENVALCVTESTEPAQWQGAGHSEPVTVLAASSCAHLTATGTRRGHVAVWSAAATLQRELAFRVDPRHETIVRHSGAAAGGTPANGAETEREQPADAESAEDAPPAGPPLELGALCLLAPPASLPAGETLRPCLVAGVSLRRPVRTQTQQTAQQVSGRVQSCTGCGCKGLVLMFVCLLDETMSL